MLQFQELPYVPEIIRSKQINCHHNDSLTRHFDIDKREELVGRKYYWLSLKKDVEAHVWRCDVCLSSKVVKHKPYGDLQFLPIPTYWWKDLSMNFVTGLPLFFDWKSNSYNFILVIVNQLTKMVHYKPVKITINAPGLAKVIINMVIWHHGLPNSITTDRGAIFIFIFWSLLCSFLDIKQRLSTAFHS